jgi:hypothetical protein
MSVIAIDWYLSSGLCVAFSALVATQDSERAQPLLQATHQRLIDGRDHHLVGLPGLRTSASDRQRFCGSFRVADRRARWPLKNSGQSALVAAASDSVTHPCHHRQQQAEDNESHPEDQETWAKAKVGTTPRTIMTFT